MLVKSSHIKRFKLGDNELISLAYEEFAVKVAFMAFRYLKDEDECKDLVMDLFEKIMKMPLEERAQRIPEGEEQFKNWLFLVAKNMCLDVLKHKVVVQNYIDANQVELESKSESERKWDKQTFDYVLNQLNDSEQRVARMHFDGFSNDEISKELKVSYNTVRNQLSAAKKKIRKYISVYLIVYLILSQI